MRVELSNTFKYSELPQGAVDKPVRVIAFAGPARRFREVLEVIKILSKQPEGVKNGK